MSDIKVKDPSKTNELHDLLETQLKRHNLRLRPGTTVSSLVSDLKTAGLELRAEYGTLVGAVGDQVANLPAAVESFAEKHPDAFFPRNVETGITSRDAMDRKGKSEFIAKHGLRAFEALPATAAEAAPTELDPATISREAYCKLPLKLKSECIRCWGSTQVARIMARAK